MAQFKKTHGRTVRRPEDLVRIMRSEANLPGLEEIDQFKIEELARSIASSGVRQPPVISHDGILLDGNRRVTASLFVLASDEFLPQEKGPGANTPCVAADRARHARKNRMLSWYPSTSSRTTRRTGPST